MECLLITHIGKRIEYTYKIICSILALSQTLKLSVDPLSPGLQPVFQRRHELIGNGSIYYPVIIGKRQADHGADRNGIIDDYRSFFNPSDSQNGHLRLANYGRGKKGSVYSRIGQADRAVLHIFRFKSFSSSSFGQICDFERDSG